MQASGRFTTNTTYYSLIYFRHTGIVVYGNEYFYGGGLSVMPPVPCPLCVLVVICECCFFVFFFKKILQGKTPFGAPAKIIQCVPDASHNVLFLWTRRLGTTSIPQEVFEEFLAEIAPRYTFQTYYSAF